MTADFALVANGYEINFIVSLADLQADMIWNDGDVFFAQSRSLKMLQRSLKP